MALGATVGGPANTGPSSHGDLDNDVDDEKRYLSQVTEESEPKQSDFSSTGNRDGDRSDSVSTRQQAPATQRRFIVDPPGELTHDETTVDIVTVPCPGGHPQRTWTRDGLMGRYFGAPSMRDAEVHESERPGPSWVRQGIRREADCARILLYEHAAIVDGTTLSSLADSLLEDLQMLRDEERRERPVVFIGHSVGGIVVKMALGKASRDARYEGILKQCYGVAFFGTPHQGSSYFAMPSLASGIQSLLQLSYPLPTSITDDLRVGNSVLLHIDDEFKAISTDLRVWTFYETIDSKLSGNASRDVYFTAPLTSIKSAILGMRQESIYPLQSDHANIASFGRQNIHSLSLFLKQLSHTISRADEYSQENVSWTLNLEQKVNIEVHGFFEDPVGPDGAATTVRAWSTRLPLREFLRKGPDVCLNDRLNEVEGIPEEGRFLQSRGRTSLMEHDARDTMGQVLAATKNALGIKQDELEHASPPGSPVIRPIDAGNKPRTESAPQMEPASALTPPSRATSPPTHHSTPMQRPSPLIRANFDQDLAIDRLSPPLRAQSGNTSFRRSLSAGGEALQVEYRDFPPFSQRSRSTIDGSLSDDDDGIEASPRLPEAVVAIRRTAKNAERRTSETVIVDEVPVAFTKPEMHSRKFVWIHLPYNNPNWVTVGSPTPSRNLTRLTCA